MLHTCRDKESRAARKMSHCSDFVREHFYKQACDVILGGGGGYICTMQRYCLRDNCSLYSKVPNWTPLHISINRGGV